MRFRSQQVARFTPQSDSHIARKIVGPGLQPIETGGGLRCGVEFGARMVDLAYRQEDATIAVDIANAFNTVRHGPIFSAIMDRYSPIARFFRWKYSTSSEMRDYSGNNGLAKTT